MFKKIKQRSTIQLILENFSNKKDQIWFYIVAGLLEYGSMVQWKKNRLYDSKCFLSYEMQFHVFKCKEHSIPTVYLILCFENRKINTHRVCSIYLRRTEIHASDLDYYTLSISSRIILKNLPVS